MGQYFIKAAKNTIFFFQICFEYTYNDSKNIFLHQTKTVLKKMIDKKSPEGLM